MATLANPGSKPECALCGGSGWKSVQISGKADRVTRCECRYPDRIEKLIEAARVPKRYEHCTLAEFNTDFDGAHRSLAPARLRAGRFVEEYPAEKTGLWFTGPIGVGKTHLAVGIIQELLRSKGIHCLFVDYRDLLKQIQNSYNPAVQHTEGGILQPVFDAEVLVLDELGAAKPSEWVFDTVGYILNSRYNQQKTTVITANYPNAPAGGIQTRTEKGVVSQETLGDRITDRMLSRLHEMCRVVEMDGSDFRKRVRNANFL